MNGTEAASISAEVYFDCVNADNDAQPCEDLLRWPRK